jgi:hypothetical protein
VCAEHGWRSICKTFSREKLRIVDAKPRRTAGDKTGLNVGGDCRSLLPLLLLLLIVCHRRQDDTVRIAVAENGCGATHAFSEQVGHQTCFIEAKASQECRLQDQSRRTIDSASHSSIFGAYCPTKDFLPGALQVFRSKKGS